MGMQTKTNYTPIIVDGNEALPFGLTLVVGQERNVSEIKIDKITRSPFSLVNVIYEITEYRDLKIVLHIDDSEEVKIIWNSVHAYEDEEYTKNFTLHRKYTEEQLYTFEKGKDEYPWRCGTYHFEIFYKQNRYIAAFRVLPKNMDEDQLRFVHDSINQELEGLTSDYLRYKKTYGALTDIQSKSFWQYFTWYEQVQSNLISSIKHIEENSQTELKKSYKVDNYLKKMDNKSVRWENSFPGNIYKGQKFYNRKMLPEVDHEANRLVKQRVHEILYQMNENIYYLKNFTEKVKNEYIRIQKEANNIQEEIDRLYVRKTTGEYKKKLNDSLKYKRNDLNKVLNQLKDLDQLKKNYLAFQKSLSIKLTTVFWNNIKNIPVKRVVLPKQFSYHMFHKIWVESKSMFSDKGVQQVSLSVLKPTHKLYEYYIFFVTMHILRDMEFISNDSSLYDQLMLYFNKEGLREGTTLSVVKDNVKINVVYDEAVEPNENLALENNKHFFSNEYNRQPDIRIDMYTFNNVRWNYESSIVIEVKYRPFNNIYVQNGQTSVMNQLDKYHQIQYVNLNDKGKREYIRDMHKIICVCPDNSMPKSMNTSYGLFLKIYPRKLEDGIFENAGKDTLRECIEDWLEQYL
jgi:hypothetical protein